MKNFLMTNAACKMWLMLVVMMSTLPVLAATTHTWTGGGSSANWSDPANWTDGLPGNGDNLTFSGTARQTNTNNLLTSIGSVVISEGGFNISGNALTINGTFGSTGSNTWSIPLRLTAAGRSFESLDGTLTLSGNITNSGNTATFKANYGIGVSGPILVSGVISGTGGVIKDGSGTATFTRDNTYSGKTTLTAGHLAVSKDSNLGTVPGTAAQNVELYGGFLEATSSFTLNSKRLVKIIATGGNTGFWANSGITLTYGGVISAMNTGTAYGLRLDGEGTIALSGTNTYNGQTTIFAYVVRISNARAFGASFSTVVEVNNLSTLELTGGINVTKPLTLDYARLVNLSGNNTWSGDAQILINSSGKSVVSAASGTQLTMGNIYINTDYETVPLNQQENLYVEGAGNVIISGGIDGDGTDGVGGYLLGHGDVVMDGTGTLTLSGANTYSGRTIVNSGVVAVSDDSNFGLIPDTATPGRVVINGGTLEALASFTLADNRGLALGPTTGTGYGTIQVDAGCVVGYAGIMADNDGGSDDFFKTGAGTLSLAGDNTFSGVTTISEGTLQIGNGGATGSLNVNSEIIDNGTLAFNQSDTVTEGVEFYSVISGTGGVAQNGSGALFLNAANTYEGPTDVNAGTLMVVNTSGSGTGTGAVTVYDAATLGGNGTIAGSVTALSGARVEPGATPSSVDTLNIGGSVTLEAGSTYEVDIGGGTTCDKLNLLNTGTMTMSSDAILDIVGTVTGDGRTLAYNIARDGITGEFIDTAAPGNLLEDKTTLHLAPNEAYTIRYMDMTTSDDGYIVLKLDPTAVGASMSAYATPNGVVVEFRTIDEAGMNDIVLYLSRDGQWEEVGRQPSTGEGSHAYRFLVPGLKAGDIVDLIVRDDEGKTYTASGLMVGDFTAQSAQIAQVNGDGLTLQWSSIPGRLYDVYRALQLGGTWEYVQTIEAVNSQATAFMAFDPAQSAGFFRIGVR